MIQMKEDLKIISEYYLSLLLLDIWINYLPPLPSSSLPLSTLTQKTFEALQVQKLGKSSSPRLDYPGLLFSITPRPQALQFLNGKRDGAYFVKPDGRGP